MPTRQKHIIRTPSVLVAEVGQGLRGPGRRIDGVPLDRVRARDVLTATGDDEAPGRANAQDCAEMIADRSENWG